MFKATGRGFYSDGVERTDKNRHPNRAKLPPNN